MISRGEEAVRERLGKVYWIGGGSGAGKSTVARRLAARFGLSTYSTDDAMTDHARRSAPQEAPLLHQFMAMDMDERWLNRTPATMLETFPWFKGEAFDLIIEDVLRLPIETGVIVEGFRLLPALVKPILAKACQAVWLLPAPSFRRAVMEARAQSGNGFLSRTSDPPTALANVLERDRLFTNILRQKTQQLDLPAIEVDATMTEEDLTRRVASMLELSDS